MLAEIPLPPPPCGLLLQKRLGVLFSPRSLDRSLFSLFAISSDVPVGLQESNFLFGGELANLHKNSATL